MSEQVKIRARYTGNKRVGYRWVGAVSGGKLCHAQNHPAAKVVEDTWLDCIDDRVPTKTVVEVPVGMLVLESGKDRGDHWYSAGVTRADPKETIDWSRAKHIEVLRQDRDPKNPRAGQVVTHIIEVDGRRGSYVEVEPHEMPQAKGNPALAGFSLEELEASIEDLQAEVALRKASQEKSDRPT